MKPKLFIGSSKENEPVLRQIEKRLNPYFDCVPWTDEVFRLNQNFLSDLIRQTRIVDYSLVIFSCDDEAIIRDKREFVPRDNLLFEHGLFLSRLGPDHAFVVCEHNVKLPSDLYGITLPYYEVTNENGNKLITEDSLRDTITELCKMSSKPIHGYADSLAIGMAKNYFDNYISVIADAMASRSPFSVKIGLRRVRLSKFVILDPCNPRTSDIKKIAVDFYKKHNLIECKIRTSIRDYSVFVDKREGIVYDMPTILNSIPYIVDWYFNECEVQVKSADCEIAKKKEFNVFFKTLKRLIEADVNCSKHIEIHGVE